MNNRLGIYSSLKLVFLIISQLILFYVLGANTQTDIWVLSRIVPIFILNVFSGIFQLSWEPIIYSSNNKKKYIKLFLGQQIIFSVLFFIGMITLKEFLWDFLNIVNSSETKSPILFNNLILISSGIFLISSFTLPLLIDLRSKNKILFSEKTEFFIELISILPLLFFLKDYGIYFFALLILLKRVLIFIIYYKKTGFIGPSFNLSLSFSLIKDNFKWLSLSRLVTLFLPMLDRIIVNSVAVNSGTLSIFNLIYSTSTSMITVSYKFFGIKKAINTCKEIKEKKFNNYLNHLNNSILSYSLLFLSLIIIFYFSIDIFNYTLFELFDYVDDQNILFYSSLFFIVMIYFGSLTNYVDSFFYCSNKIKYVVIIGIIGAIYSLILRYFLIQYFMIIGIALSISLHFAINFFIKLYYLKKETNKII
tara:strand:- start:1976 stop:3235 length:1260 start_codon:yes stop_codon:yes gene_type:complete